MEEPSPRERPNEYFPTAIEFASTIYLNQPTNEQPANFWSILRERKSARSFMPLNLEDLSALLWYTCKTTKKLDSNGWRRQKYIPSAGALHVVSVVVHNCSSSQVALYDSESHSLRELDASLQSSQRLLDHASTVLDIGLGTVFWLVADIHKMDCQYKNGISLAMRDAGVLIANLCLVAEALGLNCCPLGLLGTSILRDALNIPWQMIGVGAWVVGSR